MKRAKYMRYEVAKEYRQGDKITFDTYGYHARRWVTLGYVMDQLSIGLGDTTDKGVFSSIEIKGIGDPKY